MSIKPKKPMNSPTKTVIEMGQLRLAGNVTPNEWYEAITYTNQRGTYPHLLAITILSDLCYWYRPTEIRDEETGATIGWEKKFSGDKLQRSYQQICDRFGCSKKQAREAVNLLVDTWLVDREFRTIKTAKGSIPNVMYLEVIPHKVAEISGNTRIAQFGNICYPNGNKVLPNSATYATQFGNTNTEITPEITGENTCNTGILSDSSRIEPPPQPDQLNATGTGLPVESSAAAPNSAPAEDDAFALWFWETYNHKVGKAKCFPKLKKLSKKDRAEIRRTLDWYIADTVKGDAEKSPEQAWRPMRKNPYTYLNGRVWEDYAEADGPMIKDPVKGAQASPSSRFQATRPTIPAGYARNERLDISALPD